MKHDNPGGGLIVSLDFELMWGLAGHTSEYLHNYVPNIRNAIGALKFILRTLERHGIKVTIAHVGAMVNGDTPPLELPSYRKSIYSTYNFQVTDKWMFDEPELLFCKEFLDELAVNPMVELASHTYSHYYCLEDGQTARQFEADIEKAQAMALGAYRTIIFPRNQVSDAYLGICHKHGFTHYRGIMEDSLHKAESSRSHFSLRGALRLLDTYLPLTGQKTFKEGTMNNGMKDVPGSMFLRPYSRKLKALEPLKVRRIKQAMKHAAKRGEYFHLWWHPHNFGANTRKNLEQLEEICCCYSELNSRNGFQSHFISQI